MLEERVAALDQRLKQLEEEIKPLLEERRRLFAQKDALLRYLQLEGPWRDEAQAGEASVAEPVMTVGEAAAGFEARAATTGEEHRSLPGGTAAPSGTVVRGEDLARVIAEVLQDLGGMAHYRQIQEEITKRGYAIPGKDPGANVLAHMSARRGRFESLGRGLWRLRATGEKQAEETEE
jgi:hypothetical protein